MSYEQSANVPDDVLQAFYGGDDVAVDRLSGGLVNQTYLIHGEQGEHILQSLSPLMEQTVEDSVVVMQHMKSEGWEVPEPVTTARGTYAFKDERGTAWRAMTYIDSEPQPARLSYETLAAAGEVLGRWHTSLAKLNYEPKGELPHFHDISYHVNRLVECIDELPKSAADLGAKVLTLYEGLPAIPEAEPQLIHGDPKLSNMLYRDGKPFTLIDYDTLMTGSPWLDVGDMMRSICGQRRREGKSWWGDYLSGGSNIYSDLSAVGWEYMKARDEDYYGGLPVAARIATQHIALELSARYLNDIVDNEYFSWDDQRYPSRADNHLARAALQFDIARFWDVSLEPVSMDRCCYSYNFGKPAAERTMPEDCTGVMATGKAEGYGDGYYLEVCPRKSWLERTPGGVNFCGNGPDVVVLHSDTIPSKIDCLEAIENIDL